MAFDDPAVEAKAILRLQRQIEALSGELEALRSAVKTERLKSAVQKLKEPPKGPKGDKGERGPRGLRGERGIKGERGPAGPSGASAGIIGGGGGTKLPSGGTTGQALVKASDASGDYEWGSVAGGGDTVSCDPTKADYIFPTSDPQIDQAINTVASKVNEICAAGFAQGPQGEQGEQGVAGPQGLTGATGPQGPAGNDAPKGFGYVQYKDLTKTSAAPVALTANTRTSLSYTDTVNFTGLQGNFVGQGFFANGKFDGRTAGDTYSLRIDLTATPSVANTRLEVEIEIEGQGVVIGGDARVAEVSGANTKLFYYFDFFASQLLLDNGGRIYLTADNACNVYDIFVTVIPSTDSS